MTDVVKQRKTPLPFLAVFLLLAIIRVFELVTAGMTWRVLAYDSTVWRIVTAVSAVLLCLIVSNIARRFLSPVISILTSVVVGATATLPVNSVTGMIIGLAIGTVVTHEGLRRRVAQSMTFMMSTTVAGLANATVIGFACAATFLRVDEPHVITASLLVLSGLAGLSLLWSRRMSRGYQPGIPRAARVFVAFGTGALIGFPLGVQVDTIRRTWQANSSDALQLSVPFGYQTLVRGFWEPTRLWATNGLTLKQARLLKPFRHFYQVYVYSWSDRAFNSAGLHELNLKNVTEISGWRNPSAFTDDALSAFRESSKNLALEIRDAKITDEGLSALSQMSGLFRLDLTNANIDGSGFEHLHPRAPITFAYLSGTRLNDEGIECLSARPIEVLELSHTRVTGKCFVNSRFPSLRVLKLNGTRFREQFIPYIPLSTRWLILEGTPLSAAGLNNLAQRFSKLVKGQHLEALDIANSNLTDANVQMLKDMRIGQLRIDATNLTSAAARHLTNAKNITLVYDASKIPFDNLVASYGKLRAQILTFRPNNSLADDSITLDIHGLTVEAHMVESIRQLDCRLSHSTIKGDEDTNPRNLDVGDLLLALGDDIDSSD